MLAARTPQPGGIVILRPLSPWLFFRRNLGKTLPITFVIVVAVALVASVVSLIDSIDLTVLTMYGYQRQFAVISPRNSLAVPDDIEAGARRNPLTAEVYPAYGVFTTVKTVFGKMPLVVFGLSPPARTAIVSRCGIRLVAGRQPADGAPEAALSEEIARNRHLRIGDVVLEPRSEDSYSAIPVRLTGLYRGPVLLATTSDSFIRDNFPLAARSLIVMARSEPLQRRLDSVLDKSVDKLRARAWTYAGLVRDTRDTLANLYFITSMVVGIVVFAIAFLMGMLTNIYFTQRLPEFATLSAIGYQRSQLLSRVLSETAILCGLGWVLGLALTVVVLTGIKATVMDPRGMLLNPWDLLAYRFTLPLPITIGAFALAAIGRRLRSLDPVSIIERRQ